MRLSARNVSTNYLAYTAAIVAGLLLTPVVIDAIGKPAYGVWAVVLSITTILRLADFGLAPTVLRFTAFHRGRGDAAALDTLVSTALVVYAGIAVVLVGAGTLVAFALPSLVDLPDDIREPAQAAAFVAVAGLGLELVLGLFANVLKGAQRFDLLNLGTLVSLCVYATLVLAVLREHGTLPALALIALAAALVRLGLPAARLRRAVPGLRLSRRAVRLHELREVARFSGFAFVGHAAAKVVFAADAIVIGVALGAEPVALYAVAARLFSTASAVAATGTEVLYPVQSELEGRADRARQESFLRSGLLAGSCVAALVAVPLVFLPGPVLEVWLGDGFADSVLPLALLGAAALFTQPSVVQAQFLLARGRPGALARVQAFVALGNLSVTIAVVALTDEIWGAALATLSFEALGATVLLPRLLRREGVPPSRLATAWLRPVGLALLLAVPLLAGVPAVVDVSRFLPLAALGIAWTAAFGALAWRLALGPEERALARRLAGREATPAVDDGVV